MNNLLKKRIFQLLSDPSPTTNEEIQDAYEDFVHEIVSQNQSETDYALIIRTLNFTHIELDALGALPFYGQGKKCA